MIAYNIQEPLFGDRYCVRTVYYDLEFVFRNYDDAMYYTDTIEDYLKSKCDGTEKSDMLILCMMIIRYNQLCVMCNNAFEVALRKEVYVCVRKLLRRIISYGVSSRVRKKRNQKLEDLLRKVYGQEILTLLER